MNIRPATEDDIPRIIELYRELAEIAIADSPVEMDRSASLDDYRRAFTEICAFPGYELLVVEDKGEVVSTMVLLTAPNLSYGASPWAYVDNLVVDHRYRRRGIGKMLMDYAMAQAKDAGCHKVILLSGKKRRGAHRFYHSLGFQVTSQGFGYYF